MFQGPENTASVRSVAQTGGRWTVYSVVLTLLASIVSVVGLAALAAPASANVVPALPCNVSTGYLAQGTPTTLFAEQFGAGAATFTQIGTAATQTYNAIGINPADGYIYATELTTPDILRIDPTTGVVTDLGATTPALSGSFWNVGVFDTAGNYYTLGDSSTTMNVVNVTTLTTTSLTLSAAPIANDLSFGPGGFLWGDTGTTAPVGQIVRVNVATGAVDFFNAPAGTPQTNVYGATFTYGNGNIGLGFNGGGLYQVAIANPASASPAFTVVSSQTTASTTNNDGTSCISPPVDLGIVKTGPATVLVGGAVQWQLTVTNNSTTSPSSGYTVTDVLPTGYTAIAGTPGCTIAGQDVNCTGGELDAGASAVITVTATAPTATGCLTNVADVLGNEAEPAGQPDIDDNTSSLQTCVVTPPDLTVTKSVTPADGSTVTPGETLTYTLTFDNTGGSPATVDSTDTLTGAATQVSDPVASAGLIVAATSTNPFDITGTVAASTTSTVTYTATVNAGATGRIDNFVLDAGTTPPTVCAVGDPTCTSNPIAALVISKSVNPATGTTVTDGQSLTYTVTFDNSAGVAPATVDEVDSLADVLDDATITAAPVASGASGLHVGAVTNDAFTVTGSLAAGAVATVTYTVKVDSPDNGNQVLNNYVDPTGTPPPGSCATGDTTCTSNPVAQILALTGTPGLAQAVGGGGGLLILGALLVLLATRRQRKLFS